MSESHAVDYKSYLQRCIYIFIGVLCAISLMIYISYLPSHYTWAVKVTLILAVACINAFLVAGFLMHLLSEKKLIYTLLGFTVFFFAGLLALTLYAMQDFPLAPRINMSLKAFHLIFVTLLTALSLGFAAWGFTGDHPLLGIAGVGAAILVVFYGFYFLKKLKNISYL